MNNQCTPAFPKPNIKAERQRRKRERSQRRSQFHVAVIDRDRRCMNRYCLSLDLRNINELHAHHIIKRSQCGPDTPENGIALCTKCHKKAEEGYDDPSRGRVSARQFNIQILEQWQGDHRFRWDWALGELKKKEPALV